MTTSRTPAPSGKETGSAAAVICVKDLVKEYAIRKTSVRPFPFNLLLPDKVVKRAVDAVSFTIQTGEFVGYIGPNGAGKSTSIKILTGVLAPTAGSVEVLGRRPDRHRIENARNVGVVFGQRTQLWWDLPLRDSFEILQAIYNVPQETYRRNTEFFLTELELSRHWDTPVRQLSLGERMRAEIAAAILHDPPLLFLDEPTIGLDLVAKERIRRFLTRLNRERKVTILLTTHDITDIERLCDRLILINHGRILFDGSIDHLRGLSQENILVFELSDFDRPLAISTGTVVRREGAWITVMYDPRRHDLSQVVAEVASTHHIVNVKAEHESIESIIREMYETTEESQKAGNPRAGRSFDAG